MDMNRLLKPVFRSTVLHSAEARYNPTLPSFASENESSITMPDLYGGDFCRDLRCVQLFTIIDLVSQWVHFDAKRFFGKKK